MNGKTGVMTLRGVMPEDFERTPYFEQLFVKTGHADELIHSVGLAGGGVLRVGIARSSSRGHFTLEDVALQEAAHPVIRAFAARLAALVENSEGPRPYGPSLEEALHRFGEDVLSPREKQVVQLVLKGHNSESVAAALEIAFDTAKRHRSHAYAKLRVSSQGELFYKFLESIGLPSEPPRTGWETSPAYGSWMR